MAHMLPSLDSQPDEVLSSCRLCLQQSMRCLTTVGPHCCCFQNSITHILKHRSVLAVPHGNLQFQAVHSRLLWHADPAEMSRSPGIFTEGYTTTCLESSWLALVIPWECLLNGTYCQLEPHAGWGPGVPALLGPNAIANQQGSAHAASRRALTRVSIPFRAAAHASSSDSSVVHM